MRITRPDGKEVTFAYDALGRRIKKKFNNKIVRYLWDNNVILHQWEYNAADEPQLLVSPIGEVTFDKEEPVENLITWVYENGSFVPIGKLVDNESFSIVSDYIGRPVLAFDEKGEKVWSCDYDIYGGLRNLKGDRTFVPFRQLGQYEDEETGLYYNRFRYYDCNTGTYISQDPIGLLGGFSLYGYVKDVNSWIDVFGLSESLFRGDNFYKGGDIGLPLGSEADIMTPWEHVRRASSGESSIFTSFTEKKLIAQKFGKNPIKVSMSDIKELEAQGKIKIHTSDSVAEMMKNTGNKKIMKDINNVKQIMSKNSEILVEGIIESKYIKTCK